MKRSPMPRKRKTPRRTLSPRCTVRGCKQIARIDTFCRKHAILWCDAACRALVFQTEDRCAACGSREALQWSHHIKRGVMPIRWDYPANSCLHCSKCHLRFTRSHVLHTDWIRRYVGEAAYARLVAADLGPLLPDGSRAGTPHFSDDDLSDWYWSLRRRAA